jgi:hypothetical protein
LNHITLVAAQDKHWLAPLLLARAGHRFLGFQTQAVTTTAAAPVDAATRHAECDAPYPDAGHRAAVRAFAAQGWR